MRTTLPPLNALKAFEAAARCGSFALAAEELAVTPAAVSQLVRKLEQFLGKTLFTRFNNRIVLTDAGQAVFSGVTPALHDIAETVQRVSRTASRRKLTLSIIPSVAECWLLPMLPQFLSAHPRLRVDVRVEEEATDLMAQGVDVRIGYGRSALPEAVVQELFRDDVQPMCAPSFLSRKGGKVAFSAGLSNDLIHTQWGSTFGSNPTWRDWFAAHAPGQRVDMAAGHVVNASRIALQVAREGIGIALGHRLLAKRDLESGALVALSEKSLPLGQSHILAFPQAKARQPDVLAFREWIVKEVSGAD